MMRERPISTRGFDMEEREIFRIFRCYALNRLLPLGSFAGFTRCRQLAVLTLLHVLSAAPPAANGLDRARLADELAALLHGHGSSTTRLSDAALVKLFRLLRLARRLLDLEAGVAGHEA